MEPLEPACCMPARPAEGGLERDGVSAAFAGEVLAAELPQVLPVSSHSLSAQRSCLPELGRSPSPTAPCSSMVSLNQKHISDRLHLGLGSQYTSPS